jgi:hypothetical protein
VITVNDVIRWLAGLFPEAVLNLPPADSLQASARDGRGLKGRQTLLSASAVR